MKVDLRTPPAHPVAEMVTFAQRCEEAGFSGVGINDAQMFYRDTYIVMAQILQNTQRLRVHPALTCPGPRHTSIVAASAKTVQEFGPDRFELWMGRGGAAPTMVGMPQLRVGQMRDAIVKIKAFMAGEWGVYQPVPGRADRVRMHHGGGKPVPIYITAGGGPLVTRLAGELCDGVLLSSPLNAEGLAQRRTWLAEGAARAGRDVSEVHQILQMHCVIRETRKQAVRGWSPHLLSILAGATAEEWLQKRGIDYDVTPLKPRFQEAYTKMQAMYADSRHIQDWEAAEKISDVIPYELQEAMGDTMAVLNDPDQVTKKIRELESLGMEHVYMYPAETFNLPEQELRAFQEVIGPALNSGK